MGRPCRRSAPKSAAGCGAGTLALAVYVCLSVCLSVFLSWKPLDAVLGTDVGALLGCVVVQMEASIRRRGMLGYWSKTLEADRRTHVIGPASSRRLLAAPTSAWHLPKRLLMHRSSRQSISLHSLSQPKQGATLREYDYDSGTRETAVQPLLVWMDAAVVPTLGGPGSTLELRGQGDGDT